MQVKFLRAEIDQQPMKNMYGKNLVEKSEKSPDYLINSVFCK